MKKFLKNIWRDEGGWGLLMGGGGGGLPGMGGGGGGMNPLSMVQNPLKMITNPQSLLGGGGGGGHGKEKALDEQQLLNKYIQDQARPGHSLQQSQWLADLYKQV